MKEVYDVSLKVVVGEDVWSEDSLVEHIAEAIGAAHRFTHDPIAEDIKVHFWEER